MQKFHICIAEVIQLRTLQEIPNMYNGLQLSLTKTHNRDRDIFTEETGRQ